MDKELREQALSLVEQRGAVTENTLAKGLQIEKPAARELILDMLRTRDIIWVPELPKHGVFFKREGVKGFGLPLARKSAAPKVSERASKHQEAVLRYVLDQTDPVTVREVAEGLNLKRDAVNRALRKLQKQGKLQGHTYHTDLPGRPAVFWYTPGWFTKQEEQREALTPKQRKKSYKPTPEPTEFWSYDTDDPDVVEL